MAANITVLGRLVRDPVKRDFGGSDSTFAVFSFVTDSGAKGKDGKRKPLFIEVTAFDKHGDIILKYCRKGSQLLITGSVYDLSAYTNKQGEPVGKLSLTLEKFEFTSNPAGKATSTTATSRDAPDIDIPF